MFHVRIVSCMLIGGLALGHIPVPQPYFRSTSELHKILQNETALLPCTVDNLGENVLRWWKGDTLLADSSDSALISPRRIKMLPNKTLQIEDLEPGDAGDYTCEIIRPDPWSPLQQIQKLQVLYSPQIYPTPSDGYLEVKLGEEVQIGCMATGVPPPVVKWRTKGEMMQLIDNRHKLKFTADSRLKSGLYQCEASNGIGEAVYANIRLRILYKPEITVDRPWVHSSPGVRSELVCKVTADPEAEVVWLFQKAPLEFGSSRIVSHARGDGHTLLFRNVRATDFGEYTCKASNIMGDEEATIELSGVANPAIFKRDSGRPQPDKYTLIWEVDSYSAIIEYNLLFREYRESEDGGEWVKIIVPADGHSPGPLHSKSYMLTGLKRSTVYQAMVLSRNRYGWSNPSPIIKFATEGAGNITNEIEEETEDESERSDKNFAVQTNLMRRSAGVSYQPEKFALLTGFIATIMIILKF